MIRQLHLTSRCPGVRRLPHRRLRDRGQTSWTRFCILAAPALTTVVVLIPLAAPGTAIPYQLLSEGQTPFKVSAGFFYAGSLTARTEPFRIRDGETRTEIVAGFNRITIRNLCFSLHKPGRDRTYTLRVMIPTLRADNLTLGLDSLDGLGILGQQIDLRLPRVLSDLPVTRDLPLTRNLPLTQPPPSDPGILPIQFGNGLFSIGGTLRWVTARDFRVDDLTLHAGRNQAECY